MMTIINLQTIDEIFCNVQIKISSQAKMLYINCLIYHFKGKSPKISNATAFSIKNYEFKNFEKYKKQLHELEMAELINITSEEVLFCNAWGKYIDRTKLDKVSPEEYVAGFQFFEPSKFKKEMLNQQSLYELTEMKYKLGSNETTKLINLFIKEQEATIKTYTNYSECMRHFINWIPKNQDKIKTNTVQSKNKILGL